MSLFTLIVGSLAIAGSVTGAPSPNPQSSNPFAGITQLSFGSASGVVAGQCSGQSCQAANSAGVTGQLPTIVPIGFTDEGSQCVAQYNPAGAAALAKIKPASTGLFGGLFGKAKVKARQLGNWFASANEYTGSCSRNILIYAKGTSEVGTLGISVGPILSSELSILGLGQWSVQGVDYTADFFGNLCVGLPGGMIAKDLLASAASKCPSANLFVAGYSQGAMVAYNSVFYNTEEVRKRVKGILVYGNPFNGAKIANWSGPIKTFCKESDAVCTGQFKIGGAHLSYAFTDVMAGATWLINTAKSLQ